MKRRELLRHLNSHGCVLLREGLVAESSEEQTFSVYVNPEEIDAILLGQMPKRLSID
jgi:hypothetical protein